MSQEKNMSPSKEDPFDLRNKSKEELLEFVQSVRLERKTAYERKPKKKGLMESLPPDVVEKILKALEEEGIK